MCWLCGKPVDCTADWRIGPLAPTIDHVIPSSRGGSDDLDNLKLAHAVCNTARGDRPPTEQYEE